MYICNCGAVDERTIRWAIANGTHRFTDMCHQLNVCQQCGICGHVAKLFFDAELALMQADSEAYKRLWAAEPPPKGRCYRCQS